MKTSQLGGRVASWARSKSATPMSPNPDIGPIRAVSAARVPWVRRTVSKCSRPTPARPANAKATGTVAY